MNDVTKFTMGCRFRNCTYALFLLTRLFSKDTSQTASAKCRRCRSGCGFEKTPGVGDTPGWKTQDHVTISRDQRGFKQLNMTRNNERLNQTSLHALQTWRANCDIQILIYDTDPKNPNPAEISRVTDYVVAYACKGNATLAVERKHVRDFTLR